MTAEFITREINPRFQGNPEFGTNNSLQDSRKAILRLKDLVKVYHTGAGDFTAINNINLDIKEGEFLGIIGKSGAGKTTLLNMISGVSEITSGDVLFRAPSNGSDPGDPETISIQLLGEDDLAAWRGQNIGIVYQSFELMPQLNLVKNIMLPQDFAGGYRPKISAERAMQLLDIVELTEHAYKLPAQISGGQKQRVAIARALVNDPPVLLADEPTGNLDTVTAETILQIFEKLVENGKTIIMVTHDRNLAARFSRQVYISDGEVVSRDYTSCSTGDGDDPPGFQQNLLDEVINQAEPLEIPPDSIKVGSSTDVLPSENARLPRMPSSSMHPGQDQAAVILRDVVKTYVNAAGEFPALRGINLRMNYGQFVSIVGKSGSGKSTLLNMLTGIDHPTSGQVIVGEQDIYQMSESKRALWRGRNVGIVFQFFQLLPTLTLLENVMLPMDYCDVYPVSERPSRAMEILKMVGLEDHVDKLPSSVSSGQQQSAAIARALANDPPIIMADEPTGNLDSRSAEKILGLFSEMARRGKTILIVTHDPSFTRRTDQTVILSDGEIIDEVVARALPLLKHPQMLEATHKAEKRVYQPGSVIIEQGQKVDHLFMIARGDVDVILKNPDCPEISLARLGKGQYFGEVELIHNEDSIASVRASRGSEVELSLLPKEEFYRLLDGSPQTMDVIETVARTRLEENLAQNGDCEQA